MEQARHLPSVATRPSYRHVALIALSWVATVTIAIWPSLINGFPIFYDDSGVYIGYPDTGQAAFPPAYSYMLWRVLAVFPFSAVPVLQALITITALLLCLRTLGYPSLLVRLWMILILFAVSQLPWLISWVTTDWLGGIGLISLLCLCYSKGLQCLILSLMVAFAGLAATSNLILYLAMMPVLFFLLKLYGGTWIAGSRLHIAVITLIICLVAQFSYNRIVNHQTELAMGSSARLFSKLVDKGLAAPYFADQCRRGDAGACDALRRVTSYRDAEEFLWGTPSRPAWADEADAWNDRDRRFRRWNIAIIAHDPLGAIAAGLSDAATSATRLTLSNEGRDLISHAPAESAVPQWLRARHSYALKDFYRAAQQQGILEKLFPTNFYTATTLIGYAGFIGVFLYLFARRLGGMFILFAYILLGLIVSTLVHGGLSAPIARYTVKTSWLPIFALLVAAGASRWRSGWPNAARSARPHRPIEL